MVRDRKALSPVFILFVVILFSAESFAAKAAVSTNWTSALKGGNEVSNKRLNFATPVVASGKIYVGSSGGFFYSINFTNGKKIWGIKLDGPVISKPLFDNGIVYVGDGKGNVYSINSEKGDINWRAYVGDEVMTTPAMDDKYIYVAAENNSVTALDKSSGAVKWMSGRPQPFSGMTIRGYSSPTFIDGRIYVGNTDGTIVVYDSSDGRKLQVFPFTANRALFTDIDTSPLKRGTRLIFSTMEGALYSIDHATGKENWSAPIGTPNNIAMSGDIIYVAARGKVYAINAPDGKIVWERDLKLGEFSEPALGGKYLAVISTSDKLYILNVADGEVALERHLGGGSFGSPVIEDGKLLVISNSGQLYAFHLNE